MGVARSVLSARPVRRSAYLSTFITLGNARQPFDRLLRGVAAVDHLLPAPVFVQSGATHCAHPGWTIRDFVEMSEFERLVQQSALVIMQGGAGSIINAVRLGRLPVVMPRRAKYREIVDDHQLEFVEALGSTGRVAVALEPEDLSAAIGRALSRDAHAAAQNPAPLVDRIAQLLRTLEKR